MVALPVHMSVAYGKPDTVISVLTNAGRQMDGQSVTIEGEAVGDIVNAEEGYKWLTLLDGGASISVYVTTSDAEKIGHLGRYNSKGTRVEVTGVFQVDCEQHDGLIDVHASKLTVIEEGHTTESVLNIQEIQIGLGLLLVGVCLIFVHRQLRERTR
jgi:hypothetical protein